MAMRMAAPTPALSLAHFSFTSSPRPSLPLRRRPHHLHLPVAVFSAAAPRGPGPGPVSRRREEFVENDDEDDEFLDEGELEDEEDEGADEVFDGMQRWLENKPRGFGEGKTYDTALEEQLWEEMERSRKANELAKLRLKDGRKATDKKKEMEKQHKEVHVIPYVARVRLWNLPRKKNIHRDLQLAFKGFPGIVNISPAVVGNEKTRDPICKGFAFVDLNSEEAANRFVQFFSQKNLAFGKVQKQISCSVINTQNSLDKEDDMPTRSNRELQSESSRNRTSYNGSVGRQVINDSSRSHLLSSNEKGSLPHLKELEVHSETVSCNVENKSGNESDDADVSHLSPDEPTFSSKKQKNKGASKKKAAKKKQSEASKLALPGSFARLKVKERSVLTGILSGVLSKYSAGAAAENR